MRKAFVAVFVFAALAPSLRAQSAPLLRAVEEMRIDGERESLVPFSKLLVGRDGRVVLPQGQDSQLLFYDATGKKVGTFGRRGDGPGEFDDLFGAMGWRGDTLWVFDFNTRRLTFVSHELRLVRAQSTVEPAATAAPPANQARRLEMTNLTIDHLYPDGSMLVLWAFGPQDPESFARTDRRYVIIDRVGNILRDVTSVPPPGGRVFSRQGAGVFSQSIPFAARTFNAVAPDGGTVGLVSTPTLSGTRGSFTVTVMRANADTVFSRAYAYDAVRVPSSARDSAVSAMSAWGTRGNAAARLAGPEMAAKARSQIASFYPPVTGFLLGADGSAWLTLHAPPQNTRYRALARNGDVLGELVLPPRSTIAAATRTAVWVIETTVDGVPSIVRYAVRPAERE